MMIQTGLVDVALVGGTDAPFTYGLLKAWDALRVVSADTCRPFCNTRSGMVLGEGAGMLVLESSAHAYKRGAHVYAELAGYGMTADAGHITQPDVDGMTKSMRNALQNAQVRVEEVDYINAHGTATQMNDIAETRAIHKLFNGYTKQLAISSTKSVHGHALGAASALELVATTMALQNNVIPPTVNYLEPDEQCDLDYVPNEARDKKLDVAMCNAFAFGGLNASVVLRSVDG